MQNGIASRVRTTWSLSAECCDGGALAVAVVHRDCLVLATLCTPAFAFLAFCGSANVAEGGCALKPWRFPVSPSWRIEYYIGCRKPLAALAPSREACEPCPHKERRPFLLIF